MRGVINNFGRFFSFKLNLKPFYLRFQVLLDNEMKQKHFKNHSCV